MAYHRYIRILFGGLALLLAVLALPLPAAQAQSGERCFPETGRCIAGPIRDYWERNGGLPVFGYPITDQRTERAEDRTIQVQWFERDRLEIQADGAVTAGRLGARLLELQWRPWQRFPVNANTAPEQGCRFFAETQHWLCGDFLRYWVANGGLERFGFPITESFDELIEGQTYRVQYFERRRMELHPELGQGVVLLGLLGNTISDINERTAGPEFPSCVERLSPALRRAYAQLQTPEGIGCPVLLPGADLSASIQAFQGGEMIWLDPGRQRLGLTAPLILSYAYIGENQMPSFGVYNDTWVAGRDPETPLGTPLPGYFIPSRGFGKVWEQTPNLMGWLGWASDPQPRAMLAEYHIFIGGLMVRVYEPGSPGGIVYVVGSPATPGMVQRIDLGR